MNRTRTCIDSIVCGKGTRAKGKVEMVIRLVRLGEIDDVPRYLILLPT